MDTVGVLAEAFTGAASLEDDGRRALGRVLRCRADLEQAQLGDLTDPQHRRRLRNALCHAEEAELVRERWFGVALGDLFPGARRLGDGDVRCVGAPHLQALLCRNSADRWTCLLALTVGEIDHWCNAGPKNTAQLVGMAFERSMFGLLESGSRQRAAATADLVTVCQHESGTVRANLAALVGSSCPADVANAAARLLGVIDGDAPPSRETELDTRMADLLAAAGDARDLAVLVDRELAFRDRGTGVQLHRQLRLSAERVRQLRIRAVGRVRAAAAAAGPTVSETVDILRQRLGSVAPMAAIDDAVECIGIRPPDSTSGLLALWLAGPYRPVASTPGWLSVAPDQFYADTRRLLSDDGGARLVAEVREALAAFGIVRQHRDAWISACGSLFVDDMVVSTAGTLDDILERLFFAIGREATPAELATLTGGHSDERTVRGRLERSRRFARAGTDAYELSEWQPAPGPAPRRRQPAAPCAAAPAASGTPAIEGRLWLKVPVDRELIGGAHVAVPADLVGALGVGVHHRRTFAGRFGPVTVANEPPQPTLVSLRAIALAAGAAAGDTLTLGFGSHDELTVRLASDEPLAAEPSTASPLMAEGVV